MGIHGGAGLGTWRRAQHLEFRPAMNEPQTHKETKHPDTHARTSTLSACLLLITMLAPASISAQPEHVGARQTLAPRLALASAKGMAHALPIAWFKPA